MRHADIMRRTQESIWSILGVIALPILGFAVTYGISQVKPLPDSSDVYNGFYTLFTILLLLAVPYTMLKLVAHIAHLRNPRERELHLSDLPKDKEQLERSLI